MKPPFCENRRLKAVRPERKKGTFNEVIAFSVGPWTPRQAKTALTTQTGSGWAKRPADSVDSGL